METKHTIREDILAVVEERPDCSLEDVVRSCSEYSWNQVLFEIDRLTRSGELRLTSKSPGTYLLTAAPRLPASPCEVKDAPALPAAKSHQA